MITLLTVRSGYDKIRGDNKTKILGVSKTIKQTDSFRGFKK